MRNHSMIHVQNPAGMIFMCYSSSPFFCRSLIELLAVAMGVVWSADKK